MVRGSSRGGRGSFLRVLREINEAPVTAQP